MFPWRRMYTSLINDPYLSICCFYADHSCMCIGHQQDRLLQLLFCWFMWHAHPLPLVNAASAAYLVFVTLKFTTSHHSWRGFTDLKLLESIQCTLLLWSPLHWSKCTSVPSWVCNWQPVWKDVDIYDLLCYRGTTCSHDHCKTLRPCFPIRVAAAARAYNAL